MAYTQYTTAKTAKFLTSETWYGVHTRNGESPDMERCGNNMDLHASLPIQSLMKACILNDNGTVNYYLKPTDWAKKADDSASKLDGTDGQVMIEIPEHWYFDWNNDDDQVFAVSLTEINGWNHFNKSYVAAYEAVAERSTKKLCSLISLDANYRGGNNNDAYDAGDNTFLGKCVTLLPIEARTGIEDFRTYAQNRGTDWHPITWKLRSAIVRLFMVEYATKNSQKAVNNDLDANGYKQGGLGNGATTLTTDLTAWNGRYPFIPVGQSNSLASGSGEITYNVPFDTPEAIKVCRYRGIENIFGHMMEYNEGLVVKYDHVNSQRNVYYISNPADFTCTDETKGVLISTTEDISGCIDSVSNNYLMPITVNGIDNTKYYCDNAYYNLSNPLFTYLHVRSCGYHGLGVAPSLNGLFWIKSEDWCYMAVTYVSTRLCCHPNGY